MAGFWPRGYWGGFFSSSYWGGTATTAKTWPLGQVHDLVEYFRRLEAERHGQDKQQAAPETPQELRKIPKEEIERLAHSLAGRPVSEAEAEAERIIREHQKRMERERLAREEEEALALAVLILMLDM